VFEAPEPPVPVSKVYAFPNPFRPDRGDEQVTFEGTVIVTRYGTFIDDGNDRYLVTGELPHGQEVRIEGTRKGVRITPAKCEPAGPDQATILRQVDEFLARLEG